MQEYSASMDLFPVISQFLAVERHATSSIRERLLLRRDSARDLAKPVGRVLRVAKELRPVVAREHGADDRDGAVVNRIFSKESKSLKDEGRGAAADRQVLGRDMLDLKRVAAHRNLARASVAQIDGLRGNLRREAKSIGGDGARGSHAASRLPGDRVGHIVKVWRHIDAKRLIVARGVVEASPSL